MSRQLKACDELLNSYVDERVRVLIPKFEALAPYSRKKRETGDKNEKIEGWKLLATKEAAIIRSNYNTPESRLRQVTSLKKGLKESAKNVKDSANYHPVKTITTHFGEALSFLFSEDTIVKNTKREEKVSFQSDAKNRVELDLTSFIKVAHSVLEVVVKGGTKDDLDWRDVSCAIALVTGRRMAEIHLSGSFKKDNDYTITFKGQLKGKNRKLKIGDSKLPLIECEFNIPTLVKADLVVAGIKWLDENDKRFTTTEDPERVNRRWSKVLSAAVKDSWMLFEGMTYHKFRGAYFRACVENAVIDPYDWEKFAQEILGDDDSATIKAYKRFKIKPGSITKI